MLFHVSTETIYRGLLYKALNPAGCLYVKADMSGESFRYSQWGARNFITQTKRMVLFSQLVKRVDIVSFETVLSYRGVKDIPQEKKLLLPNGFDTDLVDWYGVTRRTFAEKENIILLVGRHGDYAKNSELMLDALEILGDTGEWQVWFVGSMTDEFRRRTERYLEQSPRQAEKVMFAGQIDDKRQLFELYSRSKVLCLTSRWEGFPNVAIEGLAFGMIPMMPGSIGCTADITDHGRCGVSFKQGSRDDLAAALSTVIEQGIELEDMAQKAQRHFSSSFQWKCILKSLDERIRLHQNNNPRT
jgi:glycosyltransferase involved in cell wall biosynthesis